MTQASQVNDKRSEHQFLLLLQPTTRLVSDTFPKTPSPQPLTQLAYRHRIQA